jgi:hypothetical protein
MRWCVLFTIDLMGLLVAGCASALVVSDVHVAHDSGAAANLPSLSAPAAPPSPTPLVTLPPPMTLAPPTPRLDRTPTAPPSAPARQAKPVATPDRLNIPSLGIDAPIRTTACGRTIPDGIWYWPCAGTNNFYLVGHDWGVFHQLQAAYHGGQLTPGMVALYSDQRAVVHRYELLWVEDLPLETFGQGDVWAATPGPVMTLQTCDGPRDDYRLIVRFVPADSTPAGPLP